MPIVLTMGNEQVAHELQKLIARELECIQRNNTVIVFDKPQNIKELKQFARGFNLGATSILKRTIKNGILK